jgi:hypothetical protein
MKGAKMSEFDIINEFLKQGCHLSFIPDNYNNTINNRYVSASKTGWYASASSIHELYENALAKGLICK